MKEIKRKSFYYIYMLLMFMWAGRVTPIFDNLGLLQNPVSFIIFFLLNCYVFRKVYSWSTLKRILPFFCILFIWYICSIFKLGINQPLPWTNFYSLIISYNGVNLYKDKLFFYFEKVLIDLCLLSLIVWGGAILLPGIIPPILKLISLPVSNSITESHIGLVGLFPDSDVFLFRRNLGFTWEPGRFSCFILLGMLFNLMRTQCRLNSNNNLYILFLSLLSTGSTTGFASFTVIILYILANKGYQSKFLTIILCVLILPFVLALPFMQEKIVNVFSLSDEIEIIDYYAEQNTNSGTWVPQRGVGLYFDYLNFSNDPLLGYGNIQNSYIFNLYKGFDIQLSNGLIQIFATYGIIIGLYFYYLCYRSTICIAKQLNISGWYFFFILFCLINVSYNFWQTSLLMMFVFYDVLTKKAQSIIL